MVDVLRLTLGGSLAAVLLLTVGPLGAQVIGTKTLEPCHLANYTQEVLCGSHTVFEDRASGAGRKIEIRFAVLPAVGASPEPDPVVIFAGGPGQAAMDLAALVRRVYSDVNERRAVILIDQRGMGDSSPLECESPEEELTVPAAELDRRIREGLVECLAEWDADVRFYTQDLANEDIHEILAALGFETANLYGGSWGTRSALLYAHQFPGSVRTIVLDGALPLENTAPLYAAADADRALRMLFADCAADAACGKAFPDLGLQFGQAMARLSPNEVSVRITDPSTGEELDALMSAATFGGMLRGILYMPDLSRLVPLIIQQASVGKYTTLMGVSGFLGSSTAGGMSIGASLAIFCSEELGRADPADLSESSEGLLGQAFLDAMTNSCSVWPKSPPPAIYSEDVRATAPTLVLSGDVDPITPPQWGDAIAEALPNSLHLVAPNTGHNVAPVGCAPDLIAQLVDQGNLDGLDGTCLLDVERPSFFVDMSGPDVRHNR